MSSKFADNTATYSEVDVTKKKTCLAAKKDKQPEILSDILIYSEINQVSETLLQGMLILHLIIKCIPWTHQTTHTQS